jgi:hypothetical protein
MLALGWFFPKLQPKLRRRRRSPKEAGRLIEFPLLQQLLTAITQQGDSVRACQFAVIALDSRRMPSDAFQYLRMSSRSLS